MIRMENGLFSLETAHTGYYIRLRGSLAETLHYGSRLHMDAAAGEALAEKLYAGYGTDVVYRKEEASFGLTHLCLELTPQQKGDCRFSPLLLHMPHGGCTADFAFADARVHKGSLPPEGLPGAYDGEETLLLDFTTPEGVTATLVYTVYPACDVITRRMVLRNNAAQPVTLQRAYSYQLDLPGADYTLSTFTGAWARERHETSRPLAVGAQTFGSTTGVSSHYCNPFFMLAQNQATQYTGEVYGFNLVYSGSHGACVEVSPFGKTRVAAGLQADGFCWTLAPGECFETPEAVLTFSAQGKNGMSRNMHAFVNRHIVRGAFANRERPVLANNWEATYFDFNEAKLLKIAKAAAKAGVELFVLDDGWFGARNDDTAGLGDYDVNRKKLPGGLAGLAEKINALGMAFGLWVEPEMVNANSALYRAHPDWAVQTPQNVPCESRNQLVLDLCRTEVQDYIIENVNAVLASAPIRYIKWDMNRPLTDNYSPALSQQGRFAHTWVRGLYRVLHAITRAHPDVLFEGCASGGNRFDLGILCYMPQIWTSDDTDAFERQKIQTGTSYGYPQSTMGCHVAAVPGHQTLRSTPIETRFNTAAFGVLGYELDFTQLTPAELRTVTAQIAWYKQHRRLLQYGTFWRLQDPWADGRCAWMVTNEDATQAVAADFMPLLTPNSSTRPLRMAGLCPEARYTVQSRPQWVNIRTFGSLINHISPVKLNAEGLVLHTAAQHYMLECPQETYEACGSVLLYAGLRGLQTFTGTGYNDHVQPLPDFGSRLYTLCAQAAPGPGSEESETNEG